MSAGYIYARLDSNPYDAGVWPMNVVIAADSKPSTRKRSAWQRVNYAPKNCKCKQSKITGVAGERPLPALAAFLLGVGAGAVAQVAVKLLPLLKDHAGRTFTAATTAGIILGLAVMFATGLLVLV